MADAINKKDLNRDGIVSKQEEQTFAVGNGDTLGVVNTKEENIKTLDTKGTEDKSDDTFVNIPGVDTKDLNKDGQVSPEELAALAAAKVEEEADKTAKYVESKKDITEQVETKITLADGETTATPEVIESPEAIVTNLQAKTQIERFNDGQAKIDEKAKAILDAETMDAQSRPEAIEAVRQYTEKGASVFAKFPNVQVVSNNRSDFLF